MAEKLQAEFDLAMKAIKDEVERTGRRYLQAENPRATSTKTRIES